MKTLGIALAIASLSALAWASDDGHNQYGYGLHSDRAGQPYRYRTQQGETAHGPVKQNAYGPNIHQDQYGRPVEARPSFGGGAPLLLPQDPQW